MVRGRYRLHFGDSRVLLPSLLKWYGKIDVFLHDSLHTLGTPFFAARCGPVGSCGVLVHDSNSTIECWWQENYQTRRSRRGGNGETLSSSAGDLMSFSRNRQDTLRVYTQTMPGRRNSGDEAPPGLSPPIEVDWFLRILGIAIANNVMRDRFSSTCQRSRQTTS